MKVKIGNRIRGIMEDYKEIDENTVTRVRKYYLDDPVALRIFDETVDAIRRSDCGKMDVLWAMGELLHSSKVTNGGGRTYEDAVGEITLTLRPDWMDMQARFMQVCRKVIKNDKTCKDLFLRRFHREYEK